MLARFITIILIFFSFQLFSQMEKGGEVHYGNEWIKEGQEYFKLSIGEDGLYQIDAQTLAEAGISTDINPSDLHLWHLGERVPLYLENDVPFNEGGKVWFIGRKHRSGLDSFLYIKSEHMLNPHYSIITDTSAYSLEIDDANPPVIFDPFSISSSPLYDISDYSIQKIESNYSSYYFQPTHDAQHIVALSGYDKAEGYAFYHNNAFTLGLEIPHLNGPVDINIRGATAYNSNHAIDIFINNVHVDSLFSSDYEVFDWSGQVDPSILTAGLNKIKLESRNSSNRFTVSHLEALFPSWFTSGDTYIKNTGANESLKDIPTGFYFDDKNKLAGKVTDAGYYLNMTGTGVIFYYSSLDEAREVQLVPMSDKGSLYEPESYLLLYPDELSDAADTYANYRQSTEGGAYSVFTVNIEAVYDHFGYGIADHPQAIRNYLHYIRSQGDTLQFINLLGKGLSSGESRSERAVNFIPSYGEPGSDLLLTAEEGSIVPMAATGRIAAVNEEDVHNYLDKVRIYDQQLSGMAPSSERIWRKNILHVVGGSPLNSGEQSLFSAYLRTMEETAEENLYGAEVKTVTKTSTDNVAKTISEEVISTVNEGVGIKTFMGHGSIVATDFGLDDPAIFDNEERLPVILSLGCLTGNMFTPLISVSENFTFKKGVGSIGYIAASGYGFPSQLKDWGTKLYSLMGGPMFGETVGEMIREIVKSRKSLTFPAALTLTQQCQLSGDPAIRLTGPPKPDYHIPFNSVVLEPGTPHVALDSLVVRFKLHNSGTIMEEYVNLQITHISADGGIAAEFIDSVMINSSIIEVEFTWPLAKNLIVGEHFLMIQIDPENSIAEAPLPVAENNNSVISESDGSMYTFLLRDNKARPVSPPDYAMINSKKLNFYASTADPFGEVKRYEFLLDTTPDFSSPALEKKTLIDSSNLLHWNNTVDLQDSTVYFWKVRNTEELNPKAEEIYSFLHIEGGPGGYNISHPWQQQQSHLENLIYDSLDNLWRFALNQRGITVEPMAGFSGDRSKIYIDNHRYYRAENTLAPNLNIMVIDPQTGQPWINQNQDYGSSNSNLSQSGYGYLYGSSSPAMRHNAALLLDSIIPAGYYVILMTYQRSEGDSYHVEDWRSDDSIYNINIYDILATQGATLLDSLIELGSRPYFIAYKKGEGVIQEMIHDSSGGKLSGSFEITHPVSNGKITTPEIGPSASFYSLHQKFHEEQEDVILYRILDTFKKVEDWVDLDISSDNYLQVEYLLKDSSERTVAHWDYTRVYAELPSDIAIGRTKSTSSLVRGQRGEEITFSYLVQNTGFKEISSPVVKYSFRDNSGEIIIYDTLGDLEENEKREIEFNIPSRELYGRGTLTVHLNPHKSFTEISFENNISSIEYEIESDEGAPILEVTFDGRYLTDGEEVGNHPVVEIILWDENDFISLKEGYELQVQITYPDGIKKILERSDPEIQVEEKDELIKWIWTPDELQQGEYHLLAQGFDTEGNRSGILPYQVKFVVKAGLHFSHLRPFPNPSPGVMGFIYSFYSDEDLYDYEIKFYDQSGKLVRSAGSKDFGAFISGANLKTKLVPLNLPPGVYYYFISTRLKRAAHIPSEMDGSIKNGFGKLILLNPEL